MAGPASASARLPAATAGVAVAAAMVAAREAAAEAAAAGALTAAVAVGGFAAVLAVAAARRRGPRGVAASAAGGIAVLALAHAVAGSALSPAFAALPLGVAALALAAALRAHPRTVVVTAVVGSAMAVARPWASDLALDVALAATATLAAAAAAARAPSLPPPAMAWGARSVAIATVAATVGVFAVLAEAAGWIAAVGGAALAGAAAAAAVAAPRASAALAAIAVVSGWWATAPPIVGAGERLLAHGGGEAVVATRSDGCRWWRVGDGVRGVVGPERVGAALATTLAFAATRPGDRVLALGDAIALARAVAALDGRVVDAVDDRLAAASLRAAMASDGCLPVAPPAGARGAALLATLRRLPAGARQAIVVGVLPTPAGPLATSAGQRELARVAAGGLVAQPFAPAIMTPDFLATWLARAAAAFPWAAVYIVGDDAVLVGGARPPSWSAAPWPDDVRWLAHRAHLDGVDDLVAACAGALDRVALAAAAPRAVDAASLLRDACRGADGTLARGSLLPLWRAQQDALAAAVARVRALPGDDAGRAEAASVAARFLPIGAPRAELQAALGLVGSDGVPLVEPARAARRAAAIAPTLFAGAPAALAVLPRPTTAIGPLEDLAALPGPARLAALAAGDEPLAVALRARFPSPCARAFVAALAAGPLPPAALQALRELADPFVLREAAAVLAPAGRLRELLGLWRGGLPMPAALTALAHGDGDDQRALAVALAGRREPSCAPALAELLCADEPAALALAATALEQLFPGAVAFDPAAPLSERRAAADRVRSLHNRAP